MSKKTIMIELTKTQIIQVHDYIINRYGGASGIINSSFIDSLVYATSYYNTIEEKAASYFYKINKDHAFRDGNKRTACLSMLQFLSLNNKRIIATNDELYNIAIKVATDEMSELLLELWLINKIESLE